MKVSLAVFALSIAALVSGCTVAEIDAKAPIPILLTMPDNDAVEFVGGIENTKRYAFHGSHHYDPYEVLRERNPERRADAIVNVRVTVRRTLTDGIFNLFTLGFADSHTVTVSGSLVRLKGSSSPDGGTPADTRPLLGGH